LPARELIHQAGTVQVLVADFDVEIVHDAAAVRSGTLGAEANFELIVKATLEQSVDQGGDLRSRRLDLAELDGIRAENLGEIGEILGFRLRLAEFGLNLFQATPSRLPLLPALIDLCLECDQGVAFTAKGRDQAVQVVHSSACCSKIRVKLGERRERRFL